MASSTQPSASSNTSQNNFSDEKEHYESLISLFKYCVTALGGLITIIGVIVSFLTYTSGNEMRAQQEKDKQELRERIQEMKAELKNREDQMGKSIDLLRTYAVDQVANAKDHAIGQIDQIQGIARSEAKKRTDEVFEKNDFDDFVEKVAKDRMEPQIEKLVDKRFETLEIAQQNKINTAIKNLASDNGISFGQALDVLQDTRESLNDDQLKEIIRVIDTEPSSKIYKVRDHTLNILQARRSPVIENFYRRELMKNQSNEDFVYESLSYLLNTDIEQDMDFYSKVLTIAKSKLIYVNFVENAFEINPKLAIQFLNSPTLANLFFEEFKGDNKTLYQNRLLKATRYGLTEEQIRNTYFFQK